MEFDIIRWYKSHGQNLEELANKKQILIGYIIYNSIRCFVEEIYNSAYIIYISRKFIPYRTSRNTNLLVQSEKKKIQGEENHAYGGAVWLDRRLLFYGISFPTPL